ncbi:fibro-slime domain-containing protein [Polyangium aurulentum]|nr:fibro-slime domain-containing protein [Polyangium aurulentum]
MGEGARGLGFALTALLLLAAACGDGGSGETGGGGNGSGAGTPSGSGAGNPGAGGAGGEVVFTTSSGAGGSGQGGAGGGDGCNPTLTATVRDFKIEHPDFEDENGTDKGIVTPELGMDGKPVYAGNPTTPTTHGKEYFDQWFRDVDGVNMALPVTIALKPVGNGMYTYDNSSFFPIDDKGFGNEGNSHNYHFTLELRTQFTYEGGEVFTFTGDDDLFTYINGKLVIDLGGVHGAQTATVDLDAKAAELGLVKGKKYPLDFFFAERHTTQSNFRIDTTIGCFTPPPDPK